MKVRFTYLVLLICLLFNLSAAGQKRMTVEQALDSNFIKLNIQGLYGFETYKNLDHSGAYFGECMAIDIQNVSDTFMILSIPVGTYLVSDDSTVQNMVVTQSAEIGLTNFINNKYKLFAMCGEIHDAVPQKGNNYTIAGFAEDEVVRLARVIENRKRQDHVGQLAMWAVANNVEQEELEEYMNEDEKDPVLNLLSEADVKVNFNKDEIPTAITLMDSSSIEKPQSVQPNDQKEMDDNSVLILAISTAAFFLLSVILSVLLRNKSRQNNIEK